MKKVLSVFILILFIIANAINFIQTADFEDIADIRLSSLVATAHADGETGDGWSEDQIDEDGLCYDCQYFMGTYVENICDCTRTTIICDPGTYPDCVESQTISIDYNSCEETGYSC
ncbi:MAG: hypothetical protein ACOC2M_00485 [bacterium]